MLDVLCRWEPCFSLSGLPGEAAAAQQALGDITPAAGASGKHQEKHGPVGTL
jgi:hypothetical protein